MLTTCGLLRIVGDHANSLSDEKACGFWDGGDQQADDRVESMAGGQINNVSVEQATSYGDLKFYMHRLSRQIST